MMNNNLISDRIEKILEENNNLKIQIASLMLQNNNSNNKLDNSADSHNDLEYEEIIVSMHGDGGDGRQRYGTE